MSRRPPGRTPVPLVMIREIRQRIRSRVFAVSTVLLVLGVLGGGVANRLLSGDDEPERIAFALVGDAAPDGFDDAVVATRGLVDVDLEQVTLPDPTDAGAERALRDELVDAVVRVDGVPPDRTGTIVTVDDAPTEVVSALDLAWRYASAHEAAVTAAAPCRKPTTTPMASNRARSSRPSTT